LNVITLTGTTASGKTALAVNLARRINAEIVSADSRQVYRGMDIGTGKDAAEYGFGADRVPCHLIDIVDAGYRYNLFEYQRDFLNACSSVAAAGKKILLCGGSGLYIEAALKGYDLPDVPPDEKLRAELERKTHEELVEMLSQMKRLHNRTDTDNKKRTIRAIEIEHYARNRNIAARERPVVNHLCFELRFDRETRRERISKRLEERLKNGLIEEVEGLLARGLTLDDMIFYGLEYKHIALMLHGKTSRSEMEKNLETAIHQFAKRQMTWFRGMERRGIPLHVIDGHKSMKEKTEEIMNYEL
jgi:tRNA dimethylallyltransferase